MKQLWNSLKVIRRLPHTILFLVAAAFYNDGIQVIIIYIIIIVITNIIKYIIIHTIANHNK